MEQAEQREQAARTARTGRSAQAGEGGPRAAARARTMARIVELGNAQLDANGPEGLSLREVARGLGMVSSAIYRYVGSRDELLTLLLVSAFDDLADAVDAALDGAGPDDAGSDGAGSDCAGPASPAERLMTLALALRAWAVANPARWALLYGTPVRGYAAPRDTVGPGVRVIARLAEIVADADAGAADAGVGDAGADGAGAGSGADALDPAVRALLEDGARDVGVQISAPAMLRATVLWSSLVGLVAAELTAQYGPEAGPLGEIVLRSQLGVLLRLL
ncbi:TetR/AcrR family transcriptional regulator [Brachybacterium sp. DNPG3]